jgi:hypothetical protein
MAKSQSWNVAENPTVAAERTKLYELQAKLADARAAVEQSTASDGDGRSAFDAAVDRELGRDVAAVAAPKLDQGEELQRYRVLSVAIERQARAVAEAEHAASLEIGKAAKPEYVSRLRKVKDALMALRPALAAEQEFRQTLYEGGVANSALPLCPFIVDEGRIDAWLAELATKYSI